MPFAQLIPWRTRVKTTETELERLVQHATTPAKRIQAGAMAMDLYAFDNWAEGIDQEKLDLASLNHCVVGQTYGFFGTGMEELRRQGMCYSAAEVGFVNMDGHHEFAGYVPYGTTKQLWLQEINARLTKRDHATQDTDLAVAGD